MSTNVSLATRIRNLEWFFLYHSGQNKYLTIWPINNGQRSEELTISQFNTLPIGFHFSINGSDRVYRITLKGVE